MGYCEREGVGVRVAAYGPFKDRSRKRGRSRKSRTSRKTPTEPCRLPLAPAPGVGLQFAIRFRVLPYSDIRHSQGYIHASRHSIKPRSKHFKSSEKSRLAPSRNTTFTSPKPSPKPYLIRAVKPLASLQDCPHTALDLDHRRSRTRGETRKARRGW